MISFSWPISPTGINSNICYIVNKTKEEKIDTEELT